VAVALQLARTVKGFSKIHTGKWVTARQKMVRSPRSDLPIGWIGPDHT
jgi:hypothetical protein